MAFSGMVGTILLYRCHLIKNACSDQYLFIMKFMSIVDLTGTYERDIVSRVLLKIRISQCGYGSIFLRGRFRMILELAAQ